MTKEEEGREMGRIMARAMGDEAFRTRLLAEATKTLREEGIPIPEGREVRAVENTDTVAYFVLPAKDSRALTDAELEAAGGKDDNPICRIHVFGYPLG